MQAYLEFFVAPDQVDQLLKQLSKFPTVTYYAVNKQGTLLTNTNNNSDEMTPNAVTWGVFPGREVTQPTIVDQASFLAWKAEAYEIWREWTNLYEPESPTGKLLAEMGDSYYLVNVVENDYVGGDIFRVFDF